MSAISVIICSHNPRPDYLRRVLDALRAQTLPQDQWELIVVDNRSDKLLADRFDFSWHPNGRHVLESQLGLATARIRGIKESKGDVLVFVDDDNVLAPNYLTEVLSISHDYPFLAAWGAGTIEPEFEVPPPRWTKPHWNRLALRSVPTVRWSNSTIDWDATPVGAGLCIRRTLATEYVTRHQSETRYQIGRKGGNFSGGEDMDIVYTASNLGLGWGNFPELKIRHLIPGKRLSLDYFLKLSEGYAVSGVLLAAKHGIQPPLELSLLSKLYHYSKLAAEFGFRSGAVFLAQQRGVRLGHRLLNNPGPHSWRQHRCRR